MEKLASNKEWIEYIKKIQEGKTLIKREDCTNTLQESITNSIKKKTNKIKKFGILFSGGIDSSLIALICKELKLNFCCYTIGLENSKDLEYAKKTAESLKIKLKTKTITINEFENNLKKTIKITGKKDIVDAGVGCVVYSAIELAKKDKIKHILTGMGADELFAGYARFEKSKGINKECISSTKNIYKDIERDFLIAEHLNTRLITPFLDEELMKLAFGIPAECKIKNNIRKYILRQIALKLGLKKEFALRKKTAAQYGSNFNKAIAKLAKKNNFKYKKDYLESLP